MCNDYLVLAICKEDNVWEYLYKSGSTPEDAVKYLHDEYNVRTVLTMDQVSILSQAAQDGMLEDAVNDNSEWFDSDDTMEYVMYCEEVEYW